MITFETAETVQDDCNLAEGIAVALTPRRRLRRARKITDLVQRTPYGPITEDALRRLYSALVTQAIRDYYHAPLDIKEDAVTWLFSDLRGYFTFRACCDLLGYNPEKIRTGTKSGKFRDMALAFVDGGVDGDELCELRTLAA